MSKDHKMCHWVGMKSKDSDTKIIYVCSYNPNHIKVIKKTSLY